MSDIGPWKTQSHCEKNNPEKNGFVAFGSLAFCVAAVMPLVLVWFF